MTGARRHAAMFEAKPGCGLLDSLNQLLIEYNRLEANNSFHLDSHLLLLLQLLQEPG